MMEMSLWKVGLNPLKSGLGFNQQMQLIVSGDLGLNPLKSGLGFNFRGYRGLILNPLSQSP